MKLINEIKPNATFSLNMGIYELNKNEIYKYGSKFVLLMAIFSDEDIRLIGVDNILQNVGDNNYEGFFDTEKEALLYAYCVQMKIQINSLAKTIAGLSKSARSKTPDFTKLRKDGDA